jgi:two-component system, chemotaxis family, CheB/CheR fusion protein
LVLLLPPADKARPVPVILCTFKAATFIAALKFECRMKQKPITPSRTKMSFPIVAIGASAGGVEAVSEFFSALSPDTGMAYIYIQHLDRYFESKLSEIISTKTEMKVMEAGHQMQIEPDHVYVIPPNKELSFVDGMLMLLPRGEHHWMPIDSFMTHLAESQAKAIGVLLSGADTDGTLGLRAIKASGGVTMAQDDSAQFRTMPRSAVSEGVADLTLSPTEMARELERLGREMVSVDEVLEEVGEAAAIDSNEDLLTILQMVKKGTGVDFSHYKMNTIKRRTLRRMLLLRIDTLKNYVEHLQQHPKELKQLYNDLLINVTTFFRDPDTLEYLEKMVIPKILKQRLPKQPVRIWVPACSTGEEAYSLAMIFLEVLGDLAANTTLQIFATDLSEQAITKARQGFYKRNDVVNISPKRLQRFFTRIDGGYRIVKQVRDLCIFAPHNIFRDPPFSRIDLVSCCNLMIYLDTILQKKVLATFHYAMNPEGYLILGKSETIGNSTQLFGQLEKKFKLFVKKKELSRKAVFEIGYQQPEYEKTDKMTPKKPISKVTYMASELEKTVDAILLNKYIPASVVVNQELEILQFRGSTGLFLEPSPGKASLNLLKMARQGLAFELRNAIHKAVKSGEPVHKDGLEVEVNKSIIRLGIEVVPLKTDIDERLFLVVFNKQDAAEKMVRKESLSKDHLVKQLEDELRAVKEDMRSIIEEQEASREELQSANEEIVSSNEELQSINEELETSKEELESTNEELMTINAELQLRNEQLAESYEYDEAVFFTIREAVLVLDTSLRVKRANPAFYKLFNTSESNVEGLLIYEINNRVWDVPPLRKLLEELLPKNQQVNDHKIVHNFKSIGEKSLLINARRLMLQDRQQLTILAMEDITSIKQHV